MESELLRRELEALEIVLARYGEAFFARMIRAALDDPEEALYAFLVSNELWGGSGSIADQAGTSQGRDDRRSIEAALIGLGARQMQEGIVNARISGWVDAFSKWRDAGI